MPRNAADCGKKNTRFTRDCLLELIPFLVRNALCQGQNHVFDFGAGSRFASFPTMSNPEFGDREELGRGKTQNLFAVADNPVKDRTP